MKFKSLALAAALLATSGVSSAAIEGYQSTGAVNNSDLVLFMYDSVRDVGYVQDLETNFLDIMNAGGPQNFIASFDLNSALLGQAFGASNLNNVTWTMMASNANTLDPINLYGSIVSTNSLQTNVAYGSVTNSNTAFGNAIEAINRTTAIGTGASAAVTLAASEATTKGPKNAVAEWGLAFNATAVDAGLNQSQQLWFAGYATGVNEDDELITVPYTHIVSPLAFTLDFANAKLSNMQPTNEVPLPAAAWLLLSGLLGLAGVARRRQA
jgi:hypothetical protein